jgi:hypothetical protein
VLSAVRGRSVADKPLSSKSFGYEEWLYETTGLPPQHAQQMEQKFFEPLDTRASKAHRLLVDGHASELTDERVRDWARFIMSIWFRTPSDVKGLEVIVKAFADPDLRDAILICRRQTNSRKSPIASSRWRRSASRSTTRSGAKL